MGGEIRLTTGRLDDNEELGRMSLTTPQARAGAAPGSVQSYLSQLDEDLRSGDNDLQTTELGFPVLDRVLGGGLHRGDLTLVGGGPGVGKTILAMQWARNLARGGRTSIYVCYEHEIEEMLVRLLALEMGAWPGPDVPAVDWLRERIVEAGENRSGLEGAVSAHPSARAALERVEAYADRLWLVSASGAHTGLEELRELIGAHDGSPALFVDYLQKVSIRPEPPNEAEKVTRIVEGLKDIALSEAVPVVAVVAADRQGLKARRVRLHHLRGSSALAFEADVALVLNEKFDAVSNVHLQYDSVRAQTYRDWVIFSIEKNRGGPTLLDLEFKKDFAHYRFDPDGAVVSEKLIDERVYSE